MIIMIDNYDSFTYNLVQEMGKLGTEMTVFRNDAVGLEELDRLKPTALIISPGPCTPSRAGISIAAVEHYAGKIPIFGVCLGHQTIIQVFGGTIVHARHIMHGKTSKITHSGDLLFKNVTSPFVAGRYHSLVGDRKTFPADLEITAESDDGEVMAIRHRVHPIVGVQFHPESVLTPKGGEIMRNFIDMI